LFRVFAFEKQPSKFFFRIGVSKWKKAKRALEQRKDFMIGAGMI
jgi:hypothetical protein